MVYPPSCVHMFVRKDVTDLITWKKHIKPWLCMGLAVVVIWGVWVTAASQTPGQAWDALESNLALKALSWELGSLPVDDELDAVAVMTISQSALLSCVRSDLATLWDTQEVDVPREEATQEAEVEEVKTPVAETPVPVEVPSIDTPDNGMPARTLVATGSGAYLVCDDVYISNTSANTITASDAMAPFAAQLTGEEPQILIIHTHGTEAYTPAGVDVDYTSYMRTLDNDYNVIAAGDAMAETLSNMGISVLHDRTAYDYPSYNASYSLSLDAMEAYVAQYPSIQFIIDVHRDAIEDSEGNQYKLVTTLDDGRTAAQLSLVVGSDGGGLTHPDWLENLRLAVAVGQELTTMNETIFRPILLRDSRYNQHVTTGSMLVEVGAAGNSPEEAILAAELFAQALGNVLLNP